MDTDKMGFGRPGRKADIARALHEAFGQQGIDLLSGRARQMVDERVRTVAEQSGISERAALGYLPDGWAEQTAADVALEREQAQIAEQSASGDVSLVASRLGALIAGLAVVVQNGVWRAMGDALPASVGEPLDCLTGLALCLQTTSVDVSAGRSGLLAAARLLGSESDALRKGYSSPDGGDADRLISVTDRLAADASGARRLAQ